MNLNQSHLVFSELLCVCYPLPLVLLHMAYAHTHEVGSSPSSRTSACFWRHLMKSNTGSPHQCDTNLAIRDSNANQNIKD